MLKHWLETVKRTPCTYTQFSVIDVTEKREPDSDIDALLQTLLIDDMFPSGFLAAMAEVLDWATVRKQIVLAKVNRAELGQKGEFGEALIGGILAEFHGYEIPLPKLRYKFTKGQSQPATDLIAIKLDTNSAVSEVCFVESKLRIGSGKNVASKATEQLQGDYNKRLPDMLRFMAERLFEQGSDIFDAFANYLADRQNTDAYDTFCLSLCWEKDEWSDEALQNLEDSEPSLDPLSVQVIRIQNLEALIKRVFWGLGITEVIDDE